MIGGRAAAPLLIVWCLIISACASSAPGDDQTASSVNSTPGLSTTSTAPDETSEPAPTTTTVVIDDSFLSETAAKVQVAEGTFMVAVVDADGVATHAGVGAALDGSGQPTSTNVFRVGSITKVFTALTTLTLVDDGLVDLGASAADYVTRVPVPEKVTVRDLLGHRSGIFNTTSVGGFIPQLLVDQTRVWTPEEQLELIEDQAPVSPPGLAFNYSNSNYVILGVLIEEVTGQAYHDVVRGRLIDPLGMSSTYLAGFEDGPEPFDPYTNPSVTEDGESYDFTSIASAAWAAGGMVSSAPDLHALFTALFGGEIISADLLMQMTDGGQYGFGVELTDWSEGLIGHTGGIPGYWTFVRHSVDSGVTGFLAMTDDGANPTPARGPLVAAMAGSADG